MRGASLREQPVRIRGARHFDFCLCLRYLPIMWKKGLKVTPIERIRSVDGVKNTAEQDGS